MAKISDGGEPADVGYHSGNGYVYVANLSSNDVSVISGTTVVATIPVGIGPHGVAYDSENGYVYVTNSFSSDVSVISTTAPLFLVTFSERGLPSGSSWSVTVEGLSNSSTTPTITFSQPNGTHSFAVARIRGDWAYYDASPASGSVTVNGAPSTVTLSFTADTRGGTVVANVRVGNPINDPIGVAYDTRNGYVYEVNDVSNNVTVISGTTVVAWIPVGSLPIGVVYNSGNGYIYVTNFGSNTVSVIDGTTVVATIPVGNGPGGVAYNGGNGYVYVANGGSWNMSVISGTTVVATIENVSAPGGVAYNSGNGYVYVTSSLDTVSAIDGTKVVATIPVGNYPGGVAYDSRNGYVYVTNSDCNPDCSPGHQDTVSVILGTTVVATVPVGTNPRGVAYNSGNGYVYVTNFASANVSVINGTTVVATIPVGNQPFGVAYNTGNGCVYVGNYNSGTVSIICEAAQLSLVTFTEAGLPSGTSWTVTMGGVSNTSTTTTIGFSEPNGTDSYAVGRTSTDAAYYTPAPSSGSVIVNGAPLSVIISFTAITAGGIVVATVPVGNYPVGVAYDSGNGYVYVANQGSSNVSVISGTTVVATVPVGFLAHGVAYDGGNGYVYVTDQASNTVSVVNGTTVVTTVPIANGPAGVAYDSGNGYVYVANSYSNNVSVINGTKVVATVPVGNYPDGVAYDSGNGYVYVANTGSNTVSVISTLAPPSSPSAPRNLVAANGDGQVVLRWQPPASDGGAPITNYTVYRGAASGGETILAIVGDVLTYTNTAVTNGYTYYYEAGAVNALGVGSRSNEVAATPRPSPDSTAPSIAISSPANNTVVSSTTVAVTGTASDNVAA